MRFILSIFVLAVLLCGCQSPVVPTRAYSLSTEFLVNGKQYQLKTSYTCHFENLTWISSRGKDWHIRESFNVVRVVGSLEDGALFELLPIPDDWRCDFCLDKAREIESRLFIEKDASTVESFDKVRNVSPTRTVEFIGTTITPIGSGHALFIDQYEWKSIQPAKHYYTVKAIIYERTVWRNYPKIIEMVNTKSILWLENGKVYPFTPWSKYDAELVNLRSRNPAINGYKDPAPRLPLVPDGEDWNFDSVDQKFIQWRVEPQPTTTAERIGSVPSQKFKRWIVYGDTRIEIPLRSYYRIFYQPELDRLIEFRVEHVKLW